MKNLFLMLFVCMASVLAFAQTNWPTVGPSVWSMGTQPVDFGFSQGFVVNNGSVNDTITISSVTVTNTPIFFVLKDGCSGMTLPPQSAASTCYITVEFFNTTMNSQSATLTVETSNGPVQANITAAAAVPDDVTLSPIDCHITSLRFPCRVSMWGVPSTTVTLTNHQATTLTINSIVAAPTGNFSIEQSLSNNSCPTMGGTVPAHGSCTITLRYTGALGDHTNGTLTVTDEAGDFTPYYIELCHKPICN